MKFAGLFYFIGMGTDIFIPIWAVSKLKKEELLLFGILFSSANYQEGWITFDLKDAVKITGYSIELMLSAARSIRDKRMFADFQIIENETVIRYFQS